MISMYTLDEKQSKLGKDGAGKPKFQPPMEEDGRGYFARRDTARQRGAGGTWAEKMPVEKTSMARGFKMQQIMPRAGGRQSPVGCGAR